jgi:branched-subunit amino acid ABC-type transport system permease component
MMNTYLAAAAGMAMVVGLVHSVLGERLVFSRMRQRQVVPTNGGTVLRPPHVRILWASWHALTALGWAMAAALLLLACEPVQTELHTSLLRIIAASMLASAALVFYGTKARHPGWLGLLAVATLTWLGIGS